METQSNQESVEDETEKREEQPLVWITEDGEEFTSTREMVRHCEQNGLYAEMVNKSTGELKTIYQAGIDYVKYPYQVPDRAQRQSKPSEPLYDREKAGEGY